MCMRKIYWILLISQYHGKDKIIAKKDEKLC